MDFSGYELWVSALDYPKIRSSVWFREETTPEGLKAGRFGTLKGADVRIGRGWERGRVEVLKREDQGVV